MKIGIITQPLIYNYGGILQNYALQQVLKMMGHNVVTINETVRYNTFRVYIRALVKSIVLKMLGRGRVFPYLLSSKERAYIYKNVNYFIEKYIVTSDNFASDEETRRYVQCQGFDAFVVGSDQVWRPCYNRNVERSYLSFAKGMDVKRLSYAASFGVNFWEYTPQQTAVVKELVKSFDAVSVREYSGIDLCKKHLDCDARLVLDPTLLLDKEHYEAVVNAENEPRSCGNMFTYILDNSIEKVDKINIVAKELGLKPFAILPQEVNARTMKSVDSCVYPPITAWLKAYMDAEFVVCDSFHGAVFSIIFNKPFLILPNGGRGNARFDSLLKLFGLEDRFVGDSLDKELIYRKIDWEAVNKRKESLRAESLMYLQQNLR